MELTVFLKEQSNYACSTKKAEHILSLLEEEGTLQHDFQDQRDFIVRSLIKRMKQLGYRLETMTGVDLVTAACLVAEVGDIGRFASPHQLQIHDEDGNVIRIFYNP